MGLSYTCKKKATWRSVTKVIVFLFFCYLPFLRTPGLGDTANTDFSEDFRGTPFRIVMYSFSMLIGVPMPTQHYFWGTKTWNTPVEILARGNVYESFSDRTSSYRSPPSVGPLGRFSAMLWCSEYRTPVMYGSLSVSLHLGLVPCRF